MLQLFVMVGSLRKKSCNRQLAHGMELLSKDLFSFTYCDVSAIPLYNQDIESPLPTAVATMKQQIAAADGVLLVSPEYNRSIPGVMKNAIDWASRPYGANAWAGKACGIVGTSPGAIGTAVVQAHLRDVMTMLGSHVMGQPEIYISYGQIPHLFAADGSIGVEDTAKFLRGYLERLANWVAKLK